QREGDGPCRCDRSMVSITCPYFGQSFYQYRIQTSNALHIRTQRMEDTTTYLIANLIATLSNQRVITDHLGGDFILFGKCGCTPFLLGESEGLFPTGQSHLASYILGELHRSLIAIGHTQHSHG